MLMAVAEAVASMFAHFVGRDMRGTEAIHKPTGLHCPAPTVRSGRTFQPVAKRSNPAYSEPSHVRLTN